MKAHPGELFIAGGYVRSRVSQEKVNDIDLFVPSVEKAMEFAKELVGEGNEKRIHKTQNALTVKGLGVTVQFIHRWTYTVPTDMLLDFDFTIASAAFWYEVDRWKSACHSDFYADLAAKRLVYMAPKRAEDAGGSLLRVLKFYQRGYRIPLDSFGAVIARLVQGVDMVKIMAYGEHREQQMAKVLTGLLREVDPNIDPDHIAHLPSTTEQVEDVEVAEEEV